MTIVYALLTAFSNALNVTTQHKASIASPPRVKGWRLVGYLFRNPLWLFGWCALAGSFVFQALALRHGQMSVVQTLLVTELVFVLVLRRFWIRQTIRRVTWWAALATCVSLAVFLSMSQPQGGNATASSRAWLWAAAASIGAAALLTVVGMMGSPPRRAALTASATAILWALVATAIKLLMDSLSQFGAVGMFGHWPVYALAATGLAAEILNQVTLHVGPLSVSQPFLVIVDPIASIALSVWVFEERFTANAATLTVAAVSFVCMCAAVSVLTRTAPATMEASAADLVGSGPAGR
jgi:drug/metabolite transporter (DMT)-like permease